MRFLLTVAGLQEAGEGLYAGMTANALKSGAVQAWGVNMTGILTDFFAKAWGALMSKLGAGLGVAFQYVVAYSGDICLVTAMILLLLCLFGSRRAVKYLYWDFAAYIIINILGGAFL